MVTSKHPGVEFNNPDLLVSHLLVPVTANQKENTAAYQNDQVKIDFKHIITPDDLDTTANLYAMHMGVLLCSLSDEQAEMLYSHQHLIKGWPETLNRVSTIDIQKLPPYGDHYSSVVARFDRHYQ